MAVDEPQPNGKPKSPPKGKMNAQQPHPTDAATRRTRRRKSKRTYVGWAADKGAKLLVWYTLFQVVFRCPATVQELKGEESRICRPYLQARDYVTPYTRPYYEQYVAPQVERAQPYFDQLNEKVYAPGLEAYGKYAAPRVEQAQKISQEQWEKTVRPQLASAQEQVGKQYQASLAPHVKKVQDVVHPFYDSLATSAHDIWELELHPVYRNTAPYAQKLYQQSQQFAVETALPQAQNAGTLAWGLWARNVWPKMRVLYGENVEPQLLRITERLGRYRDGKKLEAEIKSMEAESAVSSSSSDMTSVASSISSFVSAATKDPASAVTEATSSATPTPSTPPAEQFQSDLKSWEAICAKAVDEGAEDLKERIKDLSSTQISSQASGVGESLIIQLEQTVAGALNSVKSRIQSRVRSLPKHAEQIALDNAHSDLEKGIRNAGQSVKNSAQAVRDFKAKYDAQLDSLVAKALESTLETIDSIRELRLTEIGRKYADKGLAHKEWAKYNELKKTTQHWRDDVTKVAEASNNADIKRAKDAAEAVEERGMAVAEEAAKELGRLKDVAKWKVEAGDDGDDFNTKHYPAAAERAKRQVVENAAKASEAVVGGSESSQGVVESATSVVGEAAEAVLGSSSTGSAHSLASAASEAVMGSEQQPVFEGMTARAAESVSSLSGRAPEAVKPGSSMAGSLKEEVLGSASSGGVGTESVKASASSAAASVKASVASASAAASEAVLGSQSGLTDSATDAASTVSHSAEDAASGLSEQVIGSTPSASSLADEASSSSSSLGSKAASIMSAAKARKDSAGQAASSVTDNAGSAASSATDNAGSAVPSATDNAGSAASSATNTASSVASDASQNAASLSSAASSTIASASSKIFLGANAQILAEAREPIMDDDIVDGGASYSERIQSMASVALDQAGELTRAVAEAMGMMPTPTAMATKEGVEGVTSVVSERYEAAMSAASGVLFGTEGGKGSGSGSAMGATGTGSSVLMDQYNAAVTA